MSWFPEHQNIPVDSNLAVGQETTSLLMSALMPETRGALETDDFTFIIPVGVDSEPRGRNLSYVLLYLLTQTTAKIKIVYSETEKNLRTGVPYASFRSIRASEIETGEDALVQFFKNNSSPDKFVNRFRNEVPAEFEDGKFATEFDTIDHIMLGIAARCFVGDEAVTIGRSANWHHTLQRMGVPPNKSSMVGSRVFQNFFKECRERIDLSVVLRPDDAPFERMKYINLALAEVDTEFVVNHDADVLLTRSTLLSAVAQLKQTTVDFVYPFEHQNTRKSQMRIFQSSHVIPTLIEACLTGDFSTVATAGCHILWGSAYGQSIFARTSSYKSAGGENEHFISWGAEDVERYVRFVKLGYGVARANSGYVLHLEHPRGNDSSNNNPYFKANENLWLQLQELDPEKLLQVYRGFGYIKARGFKPEFGLMKKKA